MKDSRVGTYALVGTALMLQVSWGAEGGDAGTGPLRDECDTEGRHVRRSAAHVAAAHALPKANVAHALFKPTLRTPFPSQHNMNQAGQWLTGISHPCTLCLPQAKTGVLGALGPARASAAMVAAHCAARWTAVPLTYGCHYIQDAEDAKRGLYNW